MSKVQRYSKLILRLAFVAASLPIPALLAQPSVARHVEDSKANDVQPLVLHPNADAETSPMPVRVCVGTAVTTFGSGDTKDNAEALRQAEMSLLKSSSVESFSLNATRPEQQIEEAKAQGCDFLLSSTLSQKVQAQSRFSKLGGFKTLQMATTAAQFIPGIGVPAMLATMAASSVSSQIVSQPLTAMTQQVTAGTDITLQYSLRDGSGKTIKSGEEKAHSKSKADDVLTPMLTAVVTRVAQAAHH